MSSVFISRSLNRNSVFKKALTNANFDIIDESLIVFSAIPFSAIPNIDWIFFYSKNGVKFFFKNAPKPLSTNIKWAVIGKGTATALAKQKIQADFIGDGQPKSTATSFLLIAKGQKVLFARAENSKKSIQNLMKSEIEIYDLIVYKNIVREDFSIPTCDYLVFTSPLNAIAYFQKYDWIANQPVIAIGKTTAKTLSNLGINKFIIADSTSEWGLAKAVLSTIHNQ